MLHYYIMKKVDAHIYGDECNPSKGVSNAYDTKEHAIKQPMLCIVSGTRNSGKSFLISKMIKEASKNNTFDEVFIITPSMLSNISYFGPFVPDENVYKPTAGCIERVLARVDELRDEWEEFLQEMEEWNEFMRIIKGEDTFTDEMLFRFHDYGYLEGIPPRPVWKYKAERPPQPCLILDDCLGSRVLLESSGLATCSTLNRHIAPISPEYVQQPDGRTALGMAVIVATQSYCSRNGIPRLMRENCTTLILVGAMKHEAQLKKVAEELSGNIDGDEFIQAHSYATKKRYGSLAIEFFPDCATRTFRHNLGSYLVFPSQEAECVCKSKPKMKRMVVEKIKEDADKDATTP